MKKSLIALAVLAASGAAMAQSSVSVYGLADVWVGSVKNSTATTSARETVLESGGFATSRIGFKGTEDLGGGLKANFQIETSVAMDRPTPSSLGDRQAWVGLSGGFGAIELGRSWTPYDDTRALINDTFNANVAASFVNWVGYTDRGTNGIRYNTPSFGGLSASALVGLGEDKNTGGTNKASGLTSISLNYANGPIAAGLAYQTEKDNNNGAGVFADVTGLAGAVGVTTSKRTYTLVNGSYDFGVAKLMAGYNTVKLTSDQAVGNEAKANEYQLGVEAPLGANLAVGAGYAQSKIKLNGAEVAKTKGYTVALKYNLSKRTFGYAGLFNSKTTTPALPGDFDKTTGYFVGMQHAF